MSGWRLLLTRPEDECVRQAAALAEHGLHASCLPLLAIEPLEETPEQRSLMLDIDRYQAILVVSKPAARLVLDRLDRYWPQAPLGPRWFSVGAGTGVLLEDYGLTVDWPEAGDDSEALLALPALAAALAVPEPRVLLVKGEGGRPLLADTLRARGVQLDTLELYRRFAPRYLAGALPARVRAERLNGMVVSSGQGLQTLQALAAEAWPALCRLPLFVPSPRVAELARQLGVATVVDCRGAGTPALLAALQAHPAPAAL